MTDRTALPRRHFLLGVGGTAVSAALLAACGSHHRGAAPAGSTTTTTTSSTTITTTVANGGTTTTTERLGTDGDLSILRTLTSLELALVTAYDALGAYDVLQTDALAPAQLFRDHHRHHAGALQDLTVTAGGNPVGSENSYLMTHEVKPALLAIRGGPSVPAVRFAARLERMLAATYVTAASSLSRPVLRAGVMVSGAVEARHATFWETQLSTSAPGWVTDAEVPLYGHPGEGDGAIGADAYLGAS